MNDQEATALKYGDIIKALQGDLELLNQVVAMRDQAQADYNITKTALEEGNVQLEKLRSEIEKVRQDNAAKAEQYKSDRARLMKTLDDKIKVAKEALDRLEAEIASKGSLKGELESAVAGLRARFA